MRARFLEVGLAFGIDQSGSRIGKPAVRIGRGFMALRLDEDTPARAETAEGVVDAAGDRDQLGRHGGIQIGTAKARRALEAAVLVEDDAFRNERDPGQIVGKARSDATIFGKIHHVRVSLTPPEKPGCADAFARLPRTADRASPPRRRRSDRSPR